MTSTTPDVSERLSHIFAYWHCAALVYEAWLQEDATHSTLSAQAKATMSMGRQLVPTIMDNRITDAVIDDWRPAPEYRSLRNVIGGALAEQYCWFPVQLFQWNRNSRRTFHLPHTLAAALSAAEFGDVTWNDITWPHDAFIITLEKPFSIESAGGDFEHFDTIMVNLLPIGEKGRKSLCVRLLQAPKRSGHRHGLSQKDLSKFLKEKKRRNWDRAFKICEDARLKMVKDYPTPPGSCGYGIDPDLESNQLVAVAFQEGMQVASGPTAGEATLFDPNKLGGFEKQKMEIATVAMRIVIGWALYLETLPSERVEQVKNKHSSRTLSGGSLGVITNPDNIFHIVGNSRLGKGSQSRQRRTVEDGGFIRPHWRRAHKRRPIGSSPDAAKTIKVPQKLIREDLVPLFGIIGGTKSVMFLED